MRAPCFANAKAQAAPIPRDAPVISTPRGGALDAENDSEIAVSLILSLSIPDKTGCRSLLTCLSPLYPLQCLWFCCNVFVCGAVGIFKCEKGVLSPDTTFIRTITFFAHFTIFYMWRQAACVWMKSHLAALFLGKRKSCPPVLWNHVKTWNKNRKKQFFI